MAFADAEWFVIQASFMEPYEARRRIESILRPGGEYIGKPGGRARHIRKIPINEYEPESLFRKLSEGGVESEGSDYPGVLMDLPGVGFVGLRRPTGAKPYTVDVNIEGMRVEEWKFVEPEAAREAGRRVVSELVKGGYIRAGVPRGREDFIPWRLSADEAVERIEHEWKALGREPNISEVAWFDITGKGKVHLARSEGGAE